MRRHIETHIHAAWVLLCHSVSVYLCTVSVSTPPWGSRFCVLWRTVFAAPPTNAENAKQKNFLCLKQLLLAKRDLLFEVIAQSELCVFNKSGKMTFFSFTCLEILWRLNCGTLSVELLRILEGLRRVVRSKLKLEGKRRTTEFSGTGSCSEGLLDIPIVQ